MHQENMAIERQLLFVLLFVSGNSCVSDIPIEELKGLYSTLLTGYDVRIRPRINQSETVMVNVTFVPRSIISFDTTEQRLDFLGRIDSYWTDELLTWQPINYHGADSIKVPISEIWRPKLVIFKSYDGTGLIGDETMDMATVSASGVVNLGFEGMYSVLCEVSVQFYPFDIQTCEMIYFASDETVSTVFLNSPALVSTLEYVENSEWRLIEVKSETRLKYTTNMIHVIFKVERRSQFTMFTMILPLLLLAVLGACSFLIPIDTGEKGSFSVTIFLAFVFLVSITRDALPHNSLQIPYFIIYMCCLLSVSAFNVVYVILQSKAHASYGDKPVSFKWCFGTNKVEDSNSDTKVQPFDESDVVDDDNETKKKDTSPMTWTILLGKIDSALFAAFSVLETFFTIFFLTSVVNRHDV